MEFTLDRFALEDRVAIVTGASRGIGRAVALGLARAGADLVLAARSRGALDETAREVQALGRRAIGLPTDLARPEDITALREGAERAYGRVDVLVNNAGVNEALVPTSDLSLEEWNRTLAVNLTAAFLCCRAVGPGMVSRGRGAIVNVGSIMADVGMPRALAYCVSKAGLAALTRSLAAEWARSGVRVNLVAPGFVDTEMVAAQREDEKARGYIEKRTLLRRFGTVDEIVGAVVYLASDASSYVTGTTLTVDGGWRAG
jgi:gluconate 5-dehydrogenase